MKSRFLVAVGLIATVLTAPPGAHEVTKETVPGATNFVSVETTVACAGATKGEALPEIKKMGFASIIILWQAGEPGADVEAEAAAAKAAAGIR